MDEAAVIDKFLSGHASPLAGLGNVFVAAGRKYGVDPLLPVAISGAESSFGKHILGDHNAWGWGPGHSFGSWEDAISSITKGLRSGYLDEGRNTVAAIASKWAPQGASNDPGNLNSNWVTNVSDFLRQLGGNPGATTRRSVTTMPSMPTSPPRSKALQPPSFDDVIMGNAGLDPTAQVRNLVTSMIAAENRPQPLSPSPSRSSPTAISGAVPKSSAAAVPSATPSKSRGKADTSWLITNGSNIHMVDSNLLSHVNALAQFLGKKITVNSGWRSQAEQAALYQRYVNSGFSIAHIAAKPGQSNHQRGEAMDLSIDGVPISNAVPAATLRRFGLHNPVRGDLPHTTLLSVSG